MALIGGIISLLLGIIFTMAKYAVRGYKYLTFATSVLGLVGIGVGSLYTLIGLAGYMLNLIN